MSPVCGSRAEREKACPETAASACGERECRSRECPVVTCVPSPWRAGGPARMSDEAPATGAERRGRVVRGCCSSVNRRYREESRGRAESIWQAVPDLKGRGQGRLDQGEREQGRTRGGRAVHRGLREGPERKPVQGLEPDVLGDVLPASGDGGGNTKATRRRDPRARYSLRRGQDRADRGRGPAGGSGGTGVPPGLLRVPARQVAAGRGDGMPEALLGEQLGDRP